MVGEWTVLVWAGLCMIRSYLRVRLFGRAAEKEFNEDRVTEAQLKRQVPPLAQRDDFVVKMTALEEFPCRGRFLYAGRYRREPITFIQAQWEVFLQTNSAFLIWVAMSGNGAKIGSALKTKSASCGVHAGTMAHQRGFSVHRSGSILGLVCALISLGFVVL
jgi:hypothetical protein